MLPLSFISSAYVVFNTIMRRQVNTRAGFFVNKLHSVDLSRLSIGELRHAFNEDGPEAEAEALINSVSLRTEPLPVARQMSHQ
jgi:hypothetical protein